MRGRENGQVAIFSPNFPFGNMAVPTRFDPNESMCCSVITQYGGLQNAAVAANYDSGARFMLDIAVVASRPYDTHRHGHQHSGCSQSVRQGSRLSLGCS